MNEELNRSLPKLIMEIQTIEQAERIIHEWLEIEHNRECVVCSGNCHASVACILNMYFVMIGRIYWGIFRSDYKDNFIWCSESMPELFIGKKCELCKGEMEDHENIVALPNCNHMFHQFCLYSFIDKLTDKTSRIVCPCIDCKRIMFITHNSEINATLQPLGT